MGVGRVVGMGNSLWGMGKGAMEEGNGMGAFIFMMGKRRRNEEEEG